MTVEVQSRRLLMSPIERADIPVFVAYRQHPDVARYQGWGTDYSMTDAEALVAQQPLSGVPSVGEWLQLGVRITTDSQQGRELIGDVAVGSDGSHPNTYELGVTLSPDHQGHGYAAEALTAVIDWLMRECDAHRVHTQCDSRNDAVLALMRRIGLRHEGVVLEGDWFKGEWTSLERFALLRREWREQRD